MYAEHYIDDSRSHRPSRQGVRHELAREERRDPSDLAAGDSGARSRIVTAAADGTRIANTIRKLRFDAGEMTQAALAEGVGVTRQTIIAIEGGRYAPSLELAFRIAAAFGKPLEDVFVYRP